MVRMSSTRGMSVRCEKSTSISSPGRAREQRVIHHLDQAIAGDIRDSAAVDQAIRVEQCEVASDHGRGDPAVFGRGLGASVQRWRAIAVAARNVRDAAANEVVVDHVVMHDERGVEQLEGGADVRGGLDIRSAQRLVGARRPCAGGTACRR